jgi:DNA invertase Pin-like site-specific DNA recombinase
MMYDASKRRFSLLVFFALDRFARAGTRETIHYLQILDDYGIAYRSYSEQYIDSTGIFKDARIGGRPALDESKIRMIREMKTAGNSIVAIAKKLKISRGSVYQYLYS